jgi:hypothetical protein
LGLFDKYESGDDFHKLLKSVRGDDDDAFPPLRFTCCAKNKEGVCVHTFCHNYNKKNNEFALFCCGKKMRCFICWYGYCKGLKEKNRNDYLRGVDLPKSLDYFSFNRHCKESQFHKNVLISLLQLHYPLYLSKAKVFFRFVFLNFFFFFF